MAHCSTLRGPVLLLLSLDLDFERPPGVWSGLFQETSSVQLKLTKSVATRSQLKRRIFPNEAEKPRSSHTLGRGWTKVETFCWTSRRGWAWQSGNAHHFHHATTSSDPKGKHPKHPSRPHKSFLPEPRSPQHSPCEPAGRRSPMAARLDDQERPCNLMDTARPGTTGTGSNGSSGSRADRERIASERSDARRPWTVMPLLTCEAAVDIAYRCS